ncbi:hypothetical protein KP509_21G047700 [Ceratopteris richardii]|uniref:Peptide deformylase n=1 Tax=Ceratopteris richardii TaxID=49495 RepID=A0A8T2SBQ3_CERRI|nr:hypothetical protein KP509_21G047700 [Ceratopteris richardii]
MHAMLTSSPFKPLLYCSSLLSSSKARVFSSSPLLPLMPAYYSSVPDVRHVVEAVAGKPSSQYSLSSSTDRVILQKPSKSRVVAYGRRSLLSELQELREEKDVAGPLEYETPLNVVLYPDPRLRAKNKRISVFDENLEKFAKDMFEVMYKTDGVGLSAPQVGVNVQLMVFNPEGEKGKGEEIVLINPRIFKYSNKRSLFTEGCLSFPGIEADVERPVSVKIDAQDIKGKKFNIHLKGFQARIFQHEYDHLQSTLFFERMTPDVLETIIPALEQLEREYQQRTGLPSPEKIASSR